MSLHDLRPVAARDRAARLPDPDGSDLYADGLGERDNALDGKDRINGEHWDSLLAVICKFKPSLTHGKLRSGNLPHMDTGWTRAEGAHERLKWARKQQFETATAAAESLGLKKDTYTAYERSPESSKHTQLDHQRAIQFARKFRVSWIWLLTGEGSPMDDVLTPAQERALAAMKAAGEDEQERAADVIETLLKRA